MVMSVIPSDLACSYMRPSTSLDTALVHSADTKKETMLGQPYRIVSFLLLDVSLTIQNSELGPMVEHARHRHLPQRRISIMSITEPSMCPQSAEKHRRSLPRCFSPPLKTSLHSLRVVQPPSRPGRYAKFTAVKMPISSSSVLPDFAKSGYASG